MSTDLDRYKKSRRLLKEQNAISKQVKIAKQRGNHFYSKAVKEPHRLHKHKAMDCGNPKCCLCGNPRHIYDQLTVQEYRFYQDVENLRNKKGNGLDYEQVNDSEEI